MAKGAMRGKATPARGGGADEAGPGAARPGDRVPDIYARLAQEAETRLAPRTPAVWVRWVGWTLCVALAAGVAYAASASPW